jgi:hypothetical protein
MPPQSEKKNRAVICLNRRLVAGSLILRILYIRRASSVSKTYRLIASLVVCRAERQTRLEHGCVGVYKPSHSGGGSVGGIELARPQYRDPTAAKPARERDRDLQDIVDPSAARSRHRGIAIRSRFCARLVALSGWPVTLQLQICRDSSGTWSVRGLSPQPTTHLPSLAASVDFARQQSRAAPATIELMVDGFYAVVHQEDGWPRELVSSEAEPSLTSGETYDARGQSTLMRLRHWFRGAG